MILIKNGYVKTMSRDGDIENGQILIENGKIIAVGLDLEIPDDCEVIDANGCIVSPGFVDAHCHMGMWESSIGFEGSDGNEMTDPVTPELRAIDAINPCDEAFKLALTGGVTTSVTGPGSANVIGGTFLAMKNAGHRVDDMIIKNPVAMKCAFGENPKRIYNAQSKKPMTRMGSVSLLRKTLFEAKEYLDKKNMAVESDKEMPKFDFKLESMLPVMRGEIPLKAHAHRADDIFSSIRVAKEFGVKLTLDHCTEGHLIAEDLAKEGYPAFVGPSLGDKSKFELSNLSFETPAALNKVGVKISIITDAPVIPLNYLPLCAGLAVKSGLDEQEAWKAITINPAESIGIADRVGSIEVGKDADIAIFHGNPLKDVAFETFYTLVDGKVVYKKEDK